MAFSDILLMLENRRRRGPVTSSAKLTSVEEASHAVEHPPPEVIEISNGSPIGLEKQAVVYFEAPNAPPEAPEPSQAVANAGHDAESPHQTNGFSKGGANVRCEGPNGSVETAEQTGEFVDDGPRPDELNSEILGNVQVAVQLSQHNAEQPAAPGVANVGPAAPEPTPPPGPKILNENMEQKTVASEGARPERANSWLDIAREFPRRGSPLHQDEIRFLYWCGQAYANGTGAILDVESPLGEAGFWLAKGLDENQAVRERQRRVTIVNSFRLAPPDMEYLSTKSAKVGDDFLPLLQSRLGLEGRFVTFDRREEKMNWGVLPIEVLYAGSAKSWAAFEEVVRVFFRNLVPERSMVVLRDYAHTHAYWLHLFMQRYSSHFRVVTPHVMRSSAAWILTRPLPLQAFSSTLNQVMSVKEMLQSMDRSIDSYDQPYSTLISISKGRLIADALGVAAARDYGHKLRNSVEHLPRNLPHVDAFLKWTEAEARRSDRNPRKFIN